jgi:uncharacterized protein (TIGR04141 family)
VAKKRKLRLSWFLVKPTIDFEDVDAIVEPPAKGTLHRYRVSVLNTKQDSLFLKASHPSPPPWLSFIKSHIDGGDLPPVLGSSSSGLLLVPASDQLLAITFGYGRHLVRQEAVVQDFGLKVVLNSIDPTQIKSVDARTFDELTIHTRRGASRDSTLGVFALDNSRDLLRAVTGRSSPGGLGALTGSASLAINSDIEVPRLPELAEDLVRAYRRTRYRKNFRFIDYMRGEQDPDIVKKLDEKLVKALKAKAMTEMHLAIPEAVDWQEIAGVRFSFKQRKHEPAPDPKISLYRELRNADQISLKRLKADKVEAISAVDENEIIGRWRVYDCIVFEIDHAGHLYVLSGGDWYRIDKSHRDKVEDFVRRIPELELKLPAADKTQGEAVYNLAAARAVGGVCLDGKLVSVSGADRIEVCDVLTKDGLFIHVKKRGRSSTLSHLFAQGVTSAEMLLSDEEFRKDATKRVEKVNADFAAMIPQNPGARDEIKVAFVILSRGQRRDKPYGLPFFSMVSLKAAAERLQGAGIKVWVKTVRET